MPLSASLPTPDAEPRGHALHDDHWCLFRISRPNVLLIGQEIDTDLTVASITRWGQEQVAFWSPDPAHQLDVSQIETLIVRDVIDLSWAEQIALNEWLAARVDSVRVIATSRTPLFELVERRLFLEALYYRLNVVCLDAQDLEEAVAF